MANFPYGENTWADFGLIRKNSAHASVFKSQCSELHSYESDYWR